MTVITRHQANVGDARLSGDPQHAGVDELIRKLVKQVIGACDTVVPADPDFSREEVIVDTSIDGVRYLMIRMPSCNLALVSLSPREQEISRMVAKGYPNKTIAGVLNISCWTVCTHIRRIFAKLGVASRAAMVARLLEENRTWQRRPELKSNAPPKLRTAAIARKNASARDLAPREDK
jgi:DNA-binding CsgD family transcriptional regulator